MLERFVNLSETAPIVKQSRTLKIVYPKIES